MTDDIQTVREALEHLSREILEFPPDDREGFEDGQGRSVRNLAEAALDRVEAVVKAARELQRFQHAPPGLASRNALADALLVVDRALDALDPTEAPSDYDAAVARGEWTAEDDERDYRRGPHHDP